MGEKKNNNKSKDRRRARALQKNEWGSKITRHKGLLASYGAWHLYVSAFMLERNLCGFSYQRETY